MQFFCSNSRFFCSKIKISLLQKVLPNLIQLSHPCIVHEAACLTPLSLFFLFQFL